MDKSNLISGFLYFIETKDGKKYKDAEYITIPEKFFIVDGGIIRIDQVEHIHIYNE